MYNYWNLKLLRENVAITLNLSFIGNMVSKNNIAFEIFVLILDGLNL